MRTGNVTRRALSLVDAGAYLGLGACLLIGLWGRPPGTVGVIDLIVCTMAALGALWQPAWLAVGLAFIVGQAMSIPMSLVTYLLTLVGTYWPAHRSQRIGYAVMACGVVGVLAQANRQPPATTVALCLFLVAPALAARYYQGMFNASEQALAQAREQRAHEKSVLARELHDTISLAMTHVVLMAKEGRTGHGDSRETLEDIGMEAQLALAGLRSLLDLLRSDDPLDVPLSGLEREITHSTDVLGKAGYVVSIYQHDDLSGINGNPRVARALTLGLRELTTNVLRHAVPGTTVALVVGQSSTTANLSMSNVAADGIATLADDLPSGHGLQGMVERLAELGGEVSTYCEDGRWSTIMAVPLTTPPNPPRDPNPPVGKE